MTRAKRVDPWVKVDLGISGVKTTSWLNSN